MPHVLQGFRHGRRGDADAPGSGGYRHNGVALQVFEYAQRGCRWTAQRLDFVAVLLENGNDAARGGRGLFGGIPDAAQEEVQPGLPVALRPHPVQQFVVSRTVLLEVEAQIEDCFAEAARLERRRVTEFGEQMALPFDEAGETP